MWDVNRTVVFPLLSQRKFFDINCFQFFHEKLSALFIAIFPGKYSSISYNNVKLYIFVIYELYFYTLLCTSFAFKQQFLRDTFRNFPLRCNTQDVINSSIIFVLNYVSSRNRILYNLFQLYFTFYFTFFSIRLQLYSSFTLQYFPTIYFTTISLQHQTFEE